ncbi:hypothetical protein HBI56_028820 [Parastagonospora nodorum]|uniref:Uncharacterized protein n=1 Tax=Phaeosphaeria nodorum (strain SN15 / ATCC MYA-4574 / FGSC 10173) TaxID=321614 RepID=A0A7U2I096_PHANO|nr:hypothetical protein HBH56_016430 [Parastagonospora nodorum]QRC95101.1 hypothetical protein JI435_301970 [Parastagonospora nodorum SN15]KAH3936817.1 hypothetical protein HBH54_018030 [Parastagonospora nodorum]KAH3969214.1 hypothetical protein HBH51_122560 [Parastagonospora nodorum]KAH3990806.1 hypothetical protein HBH52_007400 [Parastagonospora nodorum]
MREGSDSCLRLFETLHAHTMRVATYVVWRAQTADVLPPHRLVMVKSEVLIRLLYQTI